MVLGRLVPALLVASFAVSARAGGPVPKAPAPRVQPAPVAAPHELDHVARTLGAGKPDAAMHATLVTRGYERVARELGGARPAPRALTDTATRWVAEARALASEPSSAFEVAAAGGNRVQAARSLREASLLLRVASHLETEPSARRDLVARASALDAEAGAPPAPAAAPSGFSSRDRRLLQTVEDLRALGYTVDIRRSPTDAFFQPPTDGSRRLVVRYTRIEDPNVASAPEDVLRHELQHLHDWARGKLGTVAVEADVARQEIRANYAGTRDVAKAVSQTRENYKFTAPYLDGLRADVLAERRAAGRPLDDASVDREVFRRSVRWNGWTPQAEAPLGGPRTP